MNEPTQRKVSTPTLQPPSLSWLRLGLSLSTPPEADLERLDLEPADLHRFSVRVARLVMARQGSMVSGHDWRPRGVMRAMLHYARRYAANAEDVRPSKVAIHNFVAWPDRPVLDHRELASLGHLLSVEALPLPTWCRQALKSMAEPGHVHGALARAFSVSAMRVRLAEETNARVCVGGKLSGYSGRYPGTLEELVLALAKEHAVYLVGWAGGLTREVIRLLQDGKAPRLLQTKPGQRDEVTAAFREVRSRVTKATRSEAPAWMPPEARPATWSMEALLAYVLRQRHLFALEYNGLSTSENEELWTTSSSESALDLILRGLSRLSASRSPRPDGAPPAPKKPPRRKRSTKLQGRARVPRAR